MKTENTPDLSSVAALIEQVISQNTVLIEHMGSMRDDIAWTKNKVSNIDEMKQDIKTIKLAVSKTNRDLRFHTDRIVALEEKLSIP